MESSDDDDLPDFPTSKRQRCASKTPKICRKVTHTTRSEAPSKARASLQWTDEMRYFMLESLSKLGEHTGAEAGFKPQTISAVVSLMCTRFPSTLFTKEKIHSAIQSLKKKFAIFDGLKSNRNTSGWGWDEDLKMVIAPDDVWVSYLQSHPEAGQFRYEGFKFYVECYEIFSKNMATGSKAMTVPKRTIRVDSQSYDDNLSFDSESEYGEDNSATAADRARSASSASDEVPSSPVDRDRGRRTSSASDEVPSSPVDRDRGRRTSSASDEVPSSPVDRDRFRRTSSAAASAASVPTTRRRRSSARPPLASTTMKDIAQTLVDFLTTNHPTSIRQQCLEILKETDFADSGTKLFIMRHFANNDGDAQMLINISPKSRREFIYRLCDNDNDNQ